MTVIICAATNCVNNDGGICAKDEVKFAFIEGSDVDLHCEDFAPRAAGHPKRWTGDTDALDGRRDEERSESVGASHQKAD
ncbi:MAG TPA: hypothetical protein VIL95_04470 [Bacillota bacterium]